MDAMQSLASTFVSGKHNEETVVKRIFHWITTNVSYDVKSFKDQNGCTHGDDTNELLNNVLRSRKALCVGYSTLCQELCRLSGVECVRVSGFCKGYDYLPGSTFKNKDPNHQWNCVNLDGVWRLVDCCWGAGYIDETSGDFIPEQRNLYCLTDPNILILDHFPSESKWQLLSSPVDRETFEKMAYVKYGYTKHKVQLCNQKESVITCKKQCNIQLSFPKPLDVLCRLLDKSLITADACVDYCLHKNHLDIECNLPYQGTFILNVYGKERNNKESTFRSIVSYAINNILESDSCNLDRAIDLKQSWGPSTNFYEMQLQQCLPIRTTLLPLDPSDGPPCFRYVSRNSHLQLKADLFRLDMEGETKLSNLTFTNRNSCGERQILVKVPGSEEFVLKVYGRMNSNADFKQVASYRVTGSTSSSSLPPFPQMTPRWLQTDCAMISPTRGTLTANRQIHFRFVLPSASDVIVLLPDKKTVRLKSIGDDTWETRCNVGSREGYAQLFVKSRTDDCYNKLLQYFVQAAKS